MLPYTGCNILFPDLFRFSDYVMHVCGNYSEYIVYKNYNAYESLLLLLILYLS